MTQGRAPGRNFPTNDLQEAMRLVRLIGDEGAGARMKRLLVAEGLGTTPASSKFRLLLRSGNRYGLIRGNEKSEYVELTELGARCARHDRQAMIEAALKPPVFGDFLRRYDNNKVPGMLTAVLREDFGVPEEHAAECGARLMSNARMVGAIRSINGSDYVMLEAAESGRLVESQPMPDGVGRSEVVGPEMASQPDSPMRPPSNRIFVSHGRGGGPILKELKEILRYGGFEPVVAVERESHSLPVPEKVLRDMTSCTFGIIHITPEKHVAAANGEVVNVLNENVLIEIGAALALYSGRIILLVADGTELPSNLQGLYQVRYEGTDLGHAGTMRLLKALTDLRAQLGDGDDPQLAA